LKSCKVNQDFSVIWLPARQTNAATNSFSPLSGRTGTAIAQRVHKTPAQVALAWAVQRGTALLTTSTKPNQIQENFEISTLPEDAMEEIRDKIAETVRFNVVVETGVPGFIPQGR
jgi:diketogulonate reductase-like aldo/keto reductase